MFKNHCVACNHRVLQKLFDTESNEICSASKNPRIVSSLITITQICIHYPWQQKEERKAGFFTGL